MEARKKSAVVAGVAGAAALLTMTSVALAAIPDSGVFTACSSVKDGSLRLIDPAAGGECRKGEQQVTWNAQGLPGAPGAPGEPGAAGEDGAVTRVAVSNPPDVTGISGSSVDEWADVVVASVPFTVTSAGFYEMRSSYVVGGDRIECGEEVFPPTEVSVRVGFDGAGSVSPSPPVKTNIAEGWLEPGSHSADIVVRPFGTCATASGAMELRSVHLAVYAY
jgi:hypothetical protein